MRHVDWRDRPAEEPADFEDVRAEEAAGLIAEALESGNEWMGLERRPACSTATGSRSRRGGWPPIPRRPAGPPRSSVDAVALKAQGPGLLHKTETGAVRIGLSGGAEVSRAAEEMDEAIAGAGARRESFVVQAMVEGGVELLVGVVGDPPSDPCSPAGRAARRPSCSRTSPFGSARSPPTEAGGCCAPSPPSRC